MLEVKVKDNSKRDKKYFETIPNIIGKIANKSLEKLKEDGIFVFPERFEESQDLTYSQMILQEVDDSYATSNLVGFLGYKNQRLFIGSRFSTGQDDFFLTYMLEQVLNIPNIFEMFIDSSNEHDIYNLLIFIFPYYLEAAMRKGLFKTYIRRHYNDFDLKGTIDIPRHIKLNTPFLGKIAYSQREFSYDNYLIQLIRHTIEFIKRKPYGNSILRGARNTVSLLVNASYNYNYFDRKKVIADNIKNPIRHAYYREYRALQQLCIMILQYNSNHIGAGLQDIHGLIFDVSWMWEEYINTLIGEDYHHPRNKEGSGREYLFNHRTGLIYPDFIGKDEENRVIIDAKYKPIENIRASDYQQILAYMYRFEAKSGYLLYPETDLAENKLLNLQRGCSYENNVQVRDDIGVIKYGLEIPQDARTYEEFRVKIRESENKLRRECK